MTSKKEIWKAHPDIPGIEVSTLGRVRTLNKVVPCRGNGTRLVKGRVLKQYDDKGGYLKTSIPINGKWTTKAVHRLVAQAFIPNHDGLPEINHKDNDRTNNNVENLEWCTREYNVAYREKYGKPAKDFVPKSPVYAVNLKTLEVLHFSSQHEAGRALGVYVQNINKVVKGNRSYAGGYYFKEDEGNGIKIDRDKLNYIVNGMRFIGGVFAVNLNTSEVSRFESQMEAGRVLGVSQGNINMVIKGKRNYAGGFWFTNADDKADDAINRKLYEIGKTGLNIR